MKNALVFVVLLISVAVGLPASGQDHATLIAQAVLPLPESLRDGAAVVWENEPGKRTVLREGTNDVLCKADPPSQGFVAQCYHKSLDPLYTRLSAVFAAGQGADAAKILDEEVAAGKLTVESGRTTYMLSGPALVGALPIMTVTLPNATAESTGLPTEQDNYRPWLMWSGTAVAHVMIPGK
jgi:hypothetical protein